jgi:hypothetical protein
MVSQGPVSPLEPIVYIDHSDVREGSLDELKAGVQRLGISSTPANLN